MAFPYTIAKVQEYLINEHYDRFRAAVMTCISNSDNHKTFRFQINEEPKPGDLVIPIIDIYWGPAGTMTISKATNMQTRFQITSPEDPDLAEVRYYELNLRAALPLMVHTLEMLSIDGDYQATLEHYRQELSHMRLSSHRDMKKWLLNSLKIYGYRCATGLPSANGRGHRSWFADPSPKKEYFKFTAYSTTAEFAAITRCLAEGAQEPTAGSLICELTDPLTGHPLGNIIPALPKIGVKLTQGEQTLDIIAVSVSSDQVELQVWLMDEERHWRLWDRLRDYLESQKLFSLKGVHSTVDTLDTICPEGQMDSSHSEQNGRDSGKQIPRDNEQEDKELSTIDQIPDVGNNQLILDLWHQGLTAKEIGLRTRRRPKTILNLLSTWRREYGEKLVPRRRTG